MKFNTLVSTVAAGLAIGCSDGYYSKPANASSQRADAAVDGYADTHTATPEAGATPAPQPSPTCTLPQHIKDAIAMALAAADCNGLQKAMIQKTDPLAKVFSFPPKDFSATGSLTFCVDQGNHTQRVSQEGYAPSQNALYLQTLTKNPHQYVSLAGIIGKTHLAILETADIAPNGTFLPDLIAVKTDIVSKPDGTSEVTVLQWLGPDNWKNLGSGTAQGCEPLLAETNKRLQQNWAETK